MATTYTTNYNLGKQENHADKFDMDVITDNADKIDAALTAKADKSTTYTKTEVDTALSGKQATLTAAQLAAANSGITSTDVAQITTNKNNISINSIKSSITMEQGYTLVTQSTLYQQGKHIFGNLIIKKDSGNFSNTSETVCTLGNPPAITGMVFCGFGGSEWGIESIGYAFLGSNGGVSVKDTITTNTTVNIAVDYVIS